MYNRYSASVCAEIGRYASRHGVAAKKLDSLICKRSYGFVPPQRTCPSRVVALSHILPNSCLPDFTINVIATNTQSSSVLVHLVFMHEKISRLIFVDGPENENLTHGKLSHRFFTTKISQTTVFDKLYMCTVL